MTDLSLFTAVLPVAGLPGRSFFDHDPLFDETVVWFILLALISILPLVSCPASLTR